MEQILKFLGLTFNEFIMSMLTLVIAGSVFFQAKFTRDLARLARETESRQRRREEPRVKFSLSISNFSDEVVDKFGENVIKFYGFSITNVSHIEITISYWNFDLGLKKDDSNISRSTYISPVKEFKGRKMSDIGFPRKLQYGDQITLLFSEQDLFSLLNCPSEDGRRRVRPQCVDSFGNTYKMECWVEWTETGTETHDNPGPGLFSSEEKQRRISSRRKWNILKYI